MEPADAPIDFGCPRCAVATQERFYGPCASCRAALVSAMAGRARLVEVDRFEPAQHVVPNQVATKE